MQQVWRRGRSRKFTVLFAIALLISAILALGFQPSPSIAFDAATSRSNWQGASFPVENFDRYTSPFGYRTAPDGSSTREFHYGLDFAAPDGSYIRSWWQGKVVEVWEDDRCGTGIAIESGAWEHIYCHMKGRVQKHNGRPYLIDPEGNLLIWEGQMVPSGARIGRVGTSGRATGPHLHWGLKYAKKWVDPAYVLRSMYSQQTS